MLDLTGNWPYIMPDKRWSNSDERLRCGRGALAQRESTTLTSWGSLVQSQYAPPSESLKHTAPPYYISGRCFALRDGAGIYAGYQMILCFGFYE